LLTNDHVADRIRVSKPGPKPAPTMPIQQQQSQISEDEVANQRRKHLLRKQAEQQQLQMD
jgi:hypothetical protein